MDNAEGSAALEARIAALEARIAALEGGRAEEDGAEAADAAAFRSGGGAGRSTYGGSFDEWIPDSAAEAPELGGEKRSSLEFKEEAEGVLQLSGFERKASDGKLSETVPEEGDDPTDFIPVKHVADGKIELKWMENDLAGTPPDADVPDAAEQSVETRTVGSGASAQKVLQLRGFHGGSPGTALAFVEDSNAGDGSVRSPDGYLVPVRYASTMALEWRWLSVPASAGIPDGFEVVSSIDGFAYASGNLTLTYSTRAYDAQNRTWGSPAQASLSVPVDSCGSS